MGGNTKGKMAKIYYTDKNGNKVQVGELPKIKVGKLLGNQHRGALIDNMRNMRRPTAQPAESSFRDKVIEAKNKKELRDVMLERYKPEQVSTSFTNKNVNMVKRILTTLDDLESRYPEMRDKVHIFDGNRKRAYASMGVDGKLSINAKWSKEDHPELYGDQNGWFHKNRTPEAVVAHEFAHAIQAKILEKKYPNDFVNGEISRNTSFLNRLNIATDWSTGTYLSPIRDRALSKLGITRVEAVQQISRYAGTNNFELFSEAFGDVFANGDNASEASKALTEELIRELRS